MAAAGSVETLIPIYKTTKRHFTADRNLYICHNENQTSYTSVLCIYLPEGKTCTMLLCFRWSVKL